MKKYLFLLLPFLKLVATEHRFDVTPSIETPILNHYGTIEFDYRSIMGSTDSFFIINPRIKPYIHRGLSSSLGMGIRKKHQDSFVGVFFYGTHTFLKKAHLFQIGPSLEFLNPKIDVRLNAYIALNPNVKINYNAIEAHSKIEGEVCYKTQKIHFGVSPSYDFGEEQIGVVARIGFPVSNGVVNITFGRDATFGKFGKVSFTLFAFGVNSGYSQQVHRHVDSFYKLKKMKQPKKNAHWVLKEKRVNPPVVKPVIIGDAKPKKKDSSHWYDFLFPSWAGGEDFSSKEVVIESKEETPPPPPPPPSSSVDSSPTYAVSEPSDFKGEDYFNDFQQWAFSEGEVQGDQPSSG